MKSGSGRGVYAVFFGIAAIFVAVYREALFGNAVFQHEGTLWYGSFHYFVESLASGHFPYWNPDLQTGTYFYPNVPFLGLLDPSVLVVVALKYLAGLSVLTGYKYFYIFRLVVFGTGAYLLFSHISKNRVGAALSAGVLVLSIAPQYLRQPGALYAGFFTPLCLYLLMRFLEEPFGEKRGIYLTAAALLYGISMNVYVPSYELFNLAAFMAGIWITGLIDVKKIGSALASRRGAALLSSGLLIVILMMGPGLMVYFFDASGNGELFPVQRVALKSGGELKKIMATDVGSEALSDDMSAKLGYFIGYGNLANVLFPDVFKSLPWFASHDYLAEMGGYIGIVAFLVALLGLFWGKSRWRFLALFMLVAIGINMVGWSGVSHKPYNLPQSFFNMIFPPLKMIDMRETFSPFFQLYLCMLLNIGLGIFLDPAALRELLDRRLKAVSAVCIGVLGLKAFVAHYFADRLVYASPYDLFIVVAAVSFALGLYVFARGVIQHRVLYAATVLLIFAELYAFNVYASFSVLMDGSQYVQMIEMGKAGGSGGFQYFREPYPAPPNAAFGENIMKVKGALSVGLNHSPFCTKRYYDFLTHLPLKQLPALTGVTNPILRFYPEESVVRAGSKYELLDTLASASDEELKSRLFLESDRVSPKKRGEVGGFDRYESIPWLNPFDLYNLNMEFMRRLEENPEAVRGTAAAVFSGPLHSLEVRNFSPNDVVVAVRNLRDGYLYYNDGWSRYWRAFDGAKELRVERADYNFKAVFISKGEHIIRFVFDPVHYKAGLFCYYLGMISAAAGLIVLYVRRFRTFGGSARA